jgi:1,4-alpha-glucan branching enzyme
VPEQHNLPPASLSDPNAEAQIDALLAGRHADPFALLGPHPISSPTDQTWAIRFFRPGAAEVSVLLHGESEAIPARHLRPEGFFEATLPGTHQYAPAPDSYRIRVRTSYGETVEAYDTYAFPFLLSEFDLHLMGEGRHYDTYDKLGAHLRTLEGVRGVHFAVWAPSARRVSIVGDFNRWDGRVNPMRARGSSGLWELLVPRFPNSKKGPSTNTKSSAHKARCSH